MANAIRLVFFDIGGVVIQADLERYLHVGCALFQATPEDLRREVTARVPDLERGTLDSQLFWKQVSETLWSRGEGRLVSPETCRHLWRDLLASTAQVDLQVMALIGALQKAGIRVGALSNTLHDHVKVLEERGVYRAFDPCALSCRLGCRKPEREIYLKAAELAHMKPRDCLLVDDLNENLEGARRAGMSALLFRGAEPLAQDLLRLDLLR
ncbi:MAG: HAD family hydrolase [Candidatus Xenobium sp.]|nr:HAD family phosphatase [Burkholderiales bacterium]